MGESEHKLNEVAIAVKQALSPPTNTGEPMSVATPGGTIQVRWDDRGNATAMGQLVYFSEFLEVTGVFDRWEGECPLHYSSGNAPPVRDVLGTWMLSILDGHRRYAHVASLRGDAVAPEILGMTKIVGDESLRRALAHIAPAPKDRHNDEQRAQQQAQVESAEKWMKNALLESVRHALTTAWILDCDPTVKPLYGKQSGAEVGYNPRKPGRPSHTVHTYWISNLRLVLYAQVQGGKSHSSKHSLPGLKKLICGLAPEQRPRLVRGDCGFGNEGSMCEMEEVEQWYLFKLKQTANVKRLIERQWRQNDWRDAGQGWQACEDKLTLIGWSRARRVIVMRRAVKGELIVEPQAPKRKGKKPAKNNTQTLQQECLIFVDKNEPAKLWEYAVLVTNSSYEIEHLGQLYRDRADCENGFDEMKNQWGWGGYSTQDIERCNLSAQAVALVYNWWSWYVRLAHPKARLEAITSRPLLLAAVGKMTDHAGQKRVLLSITHAAADKVKELVDNVRTGLKHIRTTASQLPKCLRWKALVDYIVERIIAAKWQKTTQANAPPNLNMAS